MTDEDLRVNKPKVFRSKVFDNSNLKLEVVHGDITLEDTDAIICSTNNFL